MTNMNKRYLPVFPMAFLFLFALFLMTGEQDYSTGVISVEEFQSKNFSRSWTNLNQIHNILKTA